MRFVLSLTFLLLWVPAWRPLSKYLPHPEWMIPLSGLLLAMGMGLLWRILHRPAWQRLLGKPGWAIAFVLITVLLSALIYPKADARKQLGKGSTADDAMVESARSWLETGRPYEAVLYDGAPISPGPGWVLLHSPLSILGIYWLITPLHLLFLLVAWRIGLRRGPLPLTLLMLLLGSGLLFWDLLVTGHDLIALSISLAVLTLLLHGMWIDGRIGTRWWWILAIGMGLVATSRVVFICYPLLMGLFLWAMKKRSAAIRMTTVALATAIGFHLWGFLSHEVYQPFHLFGRGERNVGTGIMAIGLLGTLALVGWAYRKLNTQLLSWLKWLSLCLLVPLTAISLGELLAVSGDLARWEGANYLMPGLVPWLLFQAEWLRERISVRSEAN